jgi:HPt (histidine-containing phosphotransfer) domain-containing protein
MPSDAPVLDRSVMAELREILEGDLDAIVAEYLRDAPRLVGEATAALAAGDSATLRRAAHSLKSTSAALGARALSWVCSKVEASARDGDLAGAAVYIPLLNDLESESSRAIASF